MDFTEFGLDERLLKGIEAAGYVNCTPVQEQVIKASMKEGAKGPDLYVQSQTGTGKTCAYLVAVIGEMIKAENAGKKCLILAPTRELAVQIEEEAKVLVGTSGLKAFSVYGGVGYEKQIANLKKGVDIVIGTPGRVIDLNEGGNLDLSNAHFCVIDEADRMFDMGFYDDLRKILKKLPEAETRQTMLFSATLNTYVKNLAWEYTRDPIEITIEAENITVSEIKQELLHVSSDEKMKLLVGILKHENPESAIIFCNTKRSCEVIAKRLGINEIKAEFMIGDLPQSKRLAIMKAFKAGEVKILVATDVAARGIDVDDLAMVINYDLPVEAENYVHREGRERHPDAGHPNLGDEHRRGTKLPYRRTPGRQYSDHHHQKRHSANIHQGGRVLRNGREDQRQHFDKQGALRLLRKRTGSLLRDASQRHDNFHQRHDTLHPPRIRQQLRSK